MRINRAIGLVLFILVAQVLLGEVLRSVSHAIIATMQTVETASQTATVQMLKVK